MEKIIKTFDILTDEEVIHCLSKAAHAKQAAINKKKYWEDLSKPVEYPVYDYEQLREAFSKNYKFIFKKEFEIDDYNAEQFDQMIHYFTGNQEKFNGDIEKGLYLVGNPGCGKSSMMRAFCFNTYQPYSFVSCSDIVTVFSSKSGGFEGIQKYTQMQVADRQKYLGFNNIGWCFDDLGSEDKGRHFGNEIEVMKDLLEKIYNNRPMIGNVHATSNESGDYIEGRYGNRVRSRMREMFNMIKFHKDSPDRRK